jgi:DNA-binding SARP family transcriptional activator
MKVGMQDGSLVKLRLSLLAAPYAWVEGQDMRIPLGLRDGVMLAWLALVGPTTRAQMAALLWPIQDESLARNSLRQRLFQLRRLLGGVDVVEGNAELRLTHNVEHDLAAGSGLLGDLQLAECPSLNAWIQSMRQQRLSEHCTVLLARLESLESQGQWAAALSLAQAVMELEPLSEQASRRVMRLRYRLGDVDGALRTYDELKARLRDNLAMTPDHTTESLRTSIANGGLPADERPDARLSDLSPNALMLARLMSLAGNAFDLPLAEGVLGIPALQFADAWHELENKRLIQGTQLGTPELQNSLQSGIPQPIAEYMRERIERHRRAH